MDRPTPDMTLQDWFAGQIMAAMIGSDGSFANQRDKNGQLCGIEPTRLANLAKNSYQVADSLMKARTVARAQHDPVGIAAAGRVANVRSAT